VQTLRFYEKMELFKPVYINPQNGYRYYTQEQFHYIDRIKYLQSMGLTLVEIREIIQRGKVEDLLFFLRKTLTQKQGEYSKLGETVSDIKWYIEYFGYMDSTRPEGQIHTAELEERYMLSAPCSPNEPFANIEMHLTMLRSKDKFKSLPYRRQYGFLLDFDDMMRQHFAPTAASIYLKRKPEFMSPYITTLPAGTYLCFRAKLRLDEWNSAEVCNFFENNVYTPVFAIANEYEDNLTEYTATPYEIQVLLQPGKPHLGITKSNQ